MLLPVREAGLAKVTPNLPEQWADPPARPWCDQVTLRPDRPPPPSCASMCRANASQTHGYCSARSTHHMHCWTLPAASCRWRARLTWRRNLRNPRPLLPLGRMTAAGRSVTRETRISTSVALSSLQVVRIASSTGAWRSYPPGREARPLLSFHLSAELRKGVSTNSHDISRHW
jgi:hypothetical protein